jgi:hypothetical protein
VKLFVSGNNFYLKKGKNLSTALSFHYILDFNNCYLLVSCFAYFKSGLS